MLPVNINRFKRQVEELALIFAVVTALCGVGSFDPLTSNDRRSDASSDPLLLQQQRCGEYETCDLRHQYCDEVIGDCVRCDDDCHPARIKGDAAATDECRRVCRYYYEFRAKKTNLRSLAHLWGKSLGKDVVAIDSKVELTKSASDADHYIRYVVHSSQQGHLWPKMEALEMPDSSTEYFWKFIRLSIVAMVSLVFVCLWLCAWILCKVASGNRLSLVDDDETPIPRKS